MTGPDDWFYDTGSGVISHITNPIEKIWFSGQSQYLRFTSLAAAQAYKAAHPATHANPFAITTPSNPLNPLIPKLPSIPHVDLAGFLSALSNGQTWLRVAEVVLGVALIIIGLVRLAPPSVAKNAKVIGKVASIL